MLLFVRASCCDGSWRAMLGKERIVWQWVHWGDVCERLCMQQSWFINYHVYGHEFQGIQKPSSKGKYRLITNPLNYNIQKPGFLEFEGSTTRSWFHDQIWLCSGCPFCPLTPSAACPWLQATVTACQVAFLLGHQGQTKPTLQLYSTLQFGKQ